MYMYVSSVVLAIMNPKTINNQVQNTDFEEDLSNVSGSVELCIDHLYRRPRRCVGVVDPTMGVAMAGEICGE